MTEWQRQSSLIVGMSNNQKMIVKLTMRNCHLFQCAWFRLYGKTKARYGICSSSWPFWYMVHPGDVELLIWTGGQQLYISKK